MAAFSAATAAPFFLAFAVVFGIACCRLRVAFCGKRLYFCERGRRLFVMKGVNYHHDAGDDERHAEPLAHVKEHGGLEIHLVVLDVFDEEA